MVFGADLSALDDNDTTARTTAEEYQQLHLVELFKTVEGWSPLRVAAAYRLHREITGMLKIGMLDPDSLPVSEITLVRESAAAPSTDFEIKRPEGVDEFDAW